MPARSWGAVLRRTASEFMDDELADKAAALTYYGVLSIFPTLLMLVSVLGTVGENATRQVLDEVKGLTPGPARDILTSSLEDLRLSGGSSGLVAVISLLGALWAASGYVAAFIRASNAVYDLPEGRPIWKITPLRVGLTLALLVLLACSLLIVVFTGSLARWAGDVIGLGDEALTVWTYAKWPVLALLVVLMLALLFWASPNAKVQGFRWLSPGSVVALVLWLLFSAGFAFYLANFASYNKTYGAMAGVAIFLLWMWLSNLAILLGLEFDAELARQRAMEGGLPADEEPYVAPRDTRKWPPGLRRRRRGVGPAGRAGEGADEAEAQETAAARKAGIERPDGVGRSDR
ncbi:YihY/virulence factor BrkB family protein [Streptomyces sp. H27-C3]|uniref:YihY/virulence factor BrkB family protein n=1 Tax=Streptomyces sp. H27-C3 TaxID=3046305 RepID=UPI0024BB9316|nr:YihY/virulence factor BrkB family protein [Streptomyces sp. H27-C3]MDJ0462785.1 YihY/virulence factor BrkB family protein [Streptomyces sp. H27-C3]